MPPDPRAAGGGFVADNLPMWDSDDLLAWSALARAPGLDAAALTLALERLGRPATLMAATSRQRIQAGLSEPASAFLSTAAGRPSAAERRWLDGAGHHLLPFTDPHFPPLLRSAADFPLVLYVSGNLEALAEPQLAIVGSRNPTPSGRGAAFDFAASLALRGLGITSGLAEGIDSAAHRGALRGQGITLAVLGNGVDRVYPRENRSLSEEIAVQGALVSEFPLGTPPRRSNFPQRNRIIAALSLGTLVVEAARHSGSLITAHRANGYGREVLAIPGSIHNPLSRGCHELIKAGAKLVENVDDVLSELNFSSFFGGRFPTSTAGSGDPAPASGMDKDHKILLDALGFDPVDLDTLIVRTGFKPEAVSSMMLILELEGHVQAAPGGRYSRVANRRAVGER